MPKPRRVAPGATYLVTRRCYQRTFRLRPSEATTHILAYCLALAIEKTGIILHAACCFLSNHHHLVVTDPRGVLPDFLRELHRLSAKAMNASQGQWENLWSAEPCSAVLLADEHDIVDKIAYVAANPVAAGLVRTPEDWPGLSLWREGVVEVKRPGAYFHENGACPERLVLRVENPSLGGEHRDTRSAWERKVRVRDPRQGGPKPHRKRASRRKNISWSGRRAGTILREACELLRAKARAGADRGGKRSGRAARSPRDPAGIPGRVSGRWFFFGVAGRGSLCRRPSRSGRGADAGAPCGGDGAGAEDGVGARGRYNGGPYP